MQSSTICGEKSDLNCNKVENLKINLTCIADLSSIVVEDSTPDSSQNSMNSAICRLRQIKARADSEKTAMIEELKCLRAKDVIMEAKLFELETKLKGDTETSKIQIRKLKNLLQVSQYENNSSREEIDGLKIVEVMLNSKISQLQQQLQEAVAINEEVLAELDEADMMDAMIVQTTNEAKVKIEPTSDCSLPPTTTVSPFSPIKRPLDNVSTSEERASPASSPSVVKKQCLTLDADRRLTPDLVNAIHSERSPTKSVGFKPVFPIFPNKITFSSVASSVASSPPDSQLIAQQISSEIIKIKAELPYLVPNTVNVNQYADPVSSNPPTVATSSADNGRLDSHCFHLSITLNEEVQREAVEVIAQQCEQDCAATVKVLLGSACLSKMIDMLGKATVNKSIKSTILGIIRRVFKHTSIDVLVQRADLKSLGSELVQMLRCSSTPSASKKAVLQLLAAVVKGCKEWKRDVILQGGLTTLLQKLSNLRDVNQENLLTTATILNSLTEGDCVVVYASPEEKAQLIVTTVSIFAAMNIPRNVIDMMCTALANFTTPPTGGDGPDQQPAVRSESSGVAGSRGPYYDAIRHLNRQIQQETTPAALRSLALTVMCNLTHPSCITSSVIESVLLIGVMRSLQNVMKSTERCITHEIVGQACECVANLCKTGNARIIESIFAVTGCLSRLVGLIQSASDPVTGQQASLAVMYITQAISPTQAASLLESGAIKAVCTILQAGDCESFHTLTAEALRSLFVLLNLPAEHDLFEAVCEVVQSSGGWQRIDQLQTSTHETIGKLARRFTK